MAFNWQTFKTRTLTAAIFVVVMLAGLLINRWTFFILFSVIHFGCWWEYLKLVEKIRDNKFDRYFKFGLMLIGFGLVIWFCTRGYSIVSYKINETLSLPISAIGFVLVVFGIFRKERIGVKSWAAASVGLVYISLPWALMMNFRSAGLPAGGEFPAEDWGVFIPGIIIFSIWINDTMAYIVGSLIGKTPLSSISPKKTWEGTIGGILLAIIVSFIYSRFKAEGLKIVLITTVAIIAGTFGDLLESKLKRMAGVKDSGHIMPGHGGFLDRFDSLLVATPFVWLYVYFVMQ